MFDLSVHHQIFVADMLEQIERVGKLFYQRELKIIK